MSASPLFRRASGEKAAAKETQRLRVVPEDFVTGELARLENSAEVRIEQASAQLREAGEEAETRIVGKLDDRLRTLEEELEVRLTKTLDARLESLDAVGEELRAEAQRMSEALETSTEAVVERASALLLEQVRRADAAELERTRIARAALQGLGDEVDRIRSDAAAAMEEHADELGKELAQSIAEQLAAVRQRADEEVEALAERAGVLVYGRIKDADSRVEGAVEALAREIDRMRSTLRAAAGEGPAPMPQPSAATTPGSKHPAVVEPAKKTRFPRLRSAFRLS